MATARPRAPFSRGAAKPQHQAGPSWSSGSSTFPALQAQGHCHNCPAGLFSLWPQEGKSLKPKRKTFMPQIQFFRFWSLTLVRTRECGAHFLSSFDMGKEILCRMKTIPLPPKQFIIPESCTAAAQSLPHSHLPLQGFHKDTHTFSGAY